MQTPIQLGFILSLPRSGSTVLTALLDQTKGIVCAPESSFPQVLGEVSARERQDPRWLAALYLAATFTPTPLDINEAQACMIGSNEEILIALGKAVGVKLGRNVDDIKTVIWKTPRTIGMHRCPLATTGRFVVLRRNPHNVFESQFRVSFGENNRNPYRFAIFQESYEHAFARIPADRRVDIGYDDLPDALPTLCRFLGVSEMSSWESGISNLEMAAKACSWMSEVTQGFNNQDPEKRARLDPSQVARLERAMKLARPLRYFIGPIRRFYDCQSLHSIRSRIPELISYSESYSNHLGSSHQALDP